MQKVLFSGGDLYEISQTISIDSSNFFYWRIAHEVMPLPVPASVYGFAILFIGLLSGVIKLAHVKDTGKLLIEIMPVMFIPAGVGLLESWPQLAPIGVPVAVITLVSTVIVMIISGKITQFVIHKEAQRKNAKKEV